MGEAIRRIPCNRRCILLIEDEIIIYNEEWFVVRHQTFLGFKPDIESPLTIHYTCIMKLTSFPRHPARLEVVASHTNQLCPPRLHNNRRKVKLTVRAATWRNKRTLEEAKLPKRRKRKNSSSKRK